MHTQNQGVFEDQEDFLESENFLIHIDSILRNLEKMENQKDVTQEEKNLLLNALETYASAFFNDPEIKANGQLYFQLLKEDCKLHENFPTLLAKYLLAYFGNYLVMAEHIADCFARLQQKDLLGFLQQLQNNLKYDQHYLKYFIILEQPAVRKNLSLLQIEDLIKQVIEFKSPVVTQGLVLFLKNLFFTNFPLEDSIFLFDRYFDNYKKYLEIFDRSENSQNKWAQAKDALQFSYAEIINFAQERIKKHPHKKEGEIKKNIQANEMHFIQSEISFLQTPANIPLPKKKVEYPSPQPLDVKTIFQKQIMHAVWKGPYLHRLNVLAKTFDNIKFDNIKNDNIKKSSSLNNSSCQFYNPREVSEFLKKKFDFLMRLFLRYLNKFLQDKKVNSNDKVEFLFGIEKIGLVRFYRETPFHEQLEKILAANDFHLAKANYAGEFKLSSGITILAR